MKSKRTKALEIPTKVKRAVYDRDGRCCVWCGSPYGLPEAHFIPRAKSGLGIEQNVLTLCRRCHRRYDFGSSAEREEMRIEFVKHLKGKYPDWDEGNLVYRKYET